MKKINEILSEKQYQYIEFKKVKQLPKTSIYECLNRKSGDLLGVVKWNVGWRQYCFYSEPSIYSVGCLNDIIDFVEGLKLDK